MKNKDNVIKEVIETGSDISGGIGGAVIGGLIAGEAGAVIGGTSGPLITKVFKTIGKEIQQRFFSDRETMRVGAVYTFALSKIQSNELQGQSIRQDDFFDQNTTNARPISEELLEGIILSAQKEYEEKKVKFLGNLYGNICTNENISKAQANQLVKFTNLLSYRQFCYLQLLYQKSVRAIELHYRIRGLENLEIEIFDIVSEIKDLQQKNLIYITTTFDDFKKVNTQIRPDDVHLTDGGKFFCEILGLSEISEIELNEINDEIQIRI